MKIRTEQLLGIALDWVVAKCEGIDVVVLTPEEQRDRWFEYAPREDLEKERTNFDMYIAPTLKPKLCVLEDDGYKRYPRHSEARMLFNQGPPQFQFSSSWAQAGPILDREEIGVRRNAPCSKGREWEALPSITAKGAGGRAGYGPTPLIAAMRCYVAAKMGDEIDVPDELTEPYWSGNHDY